MGCFVDAAAVLVAALVGLVVAAELLVVLVLVACVILLLAPLPRTRPAQRGNARFGGYCPLLLVNQRGDVLCLMQTCSE